MIRRTLLLLGSTSGLVALVVLGRGELGAPALDALGPWLDQRGPVVAAMALLRLVTMAVGVYLVVIAAAGFAAQLSGSIRLVGIVDWLTLPSIRRALGGAGVATLVVIGSSSVAASADPGPAPIPSERLVEVGAPTTSAPDTSSTTVPVSAPPTTDTIARPTEPSPPDAPRMVVIDTATTTSSTTVPSIPASVATAPAGRSEPPMTMRRITEQKPAPAAASPIDRWTIEPGQSMWSVARAHLADRRGAEPDDASIDSYWRSLMAANPEASPIGDPDVVYAGTVLVLPPTP